MSQTEHKAQLIAVNTTLKMLQEKRNLKFALASKALNDFEQLVTIQEISKIDAILSNQELL